MLGPARPLGRRAAALGLAAALALGLACDDPEASDGPAAAPAASAPAPSRPARSPGERGLRVERAADGSLHVAARGVPRFRVLQEVARAAGFAVRPGEGRPPARDLDLDLRGVSAEQALAQVLSDVPHHLHYEPAAGGGSTLARVTVGALPAELAAPRRAEGGRRKSPRSASSAPAREPDEGERLAEVIARAGSPEAAERARAAAQLRPEAQLADLVAAASGDPDPAVRTAAVQSLAEVEGGETAFHAADALLAATLDPDGGVAAAAIRGLEDVHDLLPDPRFRARIAALADHRDARVRAAAASFLEWTDDEW